MIVLQAAAAKLAASKKAGAGAPQLPGLTGSNAAAVDAALSAAESAADDDVVSAAKERVEWRLGVLTGSMEQLLQHVFGLLGRLSEVSGGMGMSLQPHSFAIAVYVCRLRPHSFAALRRTQERARARRMPVLANFVLIPVCYNK